MSNKLFMHFPLICKYTGCNRIPLHGHWIWIPEATGRRFCKGTFFDTIHSRTVLLFFPWAISYGRPSACPILLAALSATLLPSGSYRKISLYKICGLWPLETISSVRVV